MKYRFNARELNVGARMLSDATGPCHVEPQVFDLLQYLIENRSRVVDKDELIARVWKGRAVSDATIASRVNAARKVAGDNGRQQQVIVTIHRKGFRFVADVEVDASELGGVPALAVMPFECLSVNAADHHLARGLAEQLASTLGQAAWFDVRDTSASFAPMLADKTPRQAAEMLRADYLVRGTLQVGATTLRLAIRLIEPARERQIWSATLTGGTVDVFDIQDEIATRVLGEIEPRLRRLELQRSVDRHGNFTAFDHYLRAADSLRTMDLPAMKAARAELDLALVAHPTYAAAHGMHAWIGTLMLPQGHATSRQHEALHYRSALAEGGFDCDALAMGGYALGFFERDSATGHGYVQRALAINPSAARAHDFAGWLLLYMGRADDGLTHFDRALALCPLDEFAFRTLTGRAFARLFRGDFEGAVMDARRAHAAAANYTVCHRVLAAALAHTGRTREAATAMASLLRHNPGLSLARYSKETRFDDPHHRELLFHGLRMAGLS